MEGKDHMNGSNELEKGYRHFRDVSFKKNKDRFRKLVEEGQSPKALFIGCSDSRVMPAMITGSGPGDLFIVRNIGNFVPPFEPDNDFHSTAAAIEYAVVNLKVSELIVCGHSDCGAIKALFEEHSSTEDNIHMIKWLQLGKPASDLAIEVLPQRSLTERRVYAEKVSVIFQLENLMTYPAVRKAIEKGDLFLHGWYYDMANGTIYYYDEEHMEFRLLGEHEKG